MSDDSGPDDADSAAGAGSTAGSAPDDGPSGSEADDRETTTPTASPDDPGPAGADVAVAVVDAETPGNVGTIARAMKNFGLSELYLVDPPELDPDGEAYGFAGRAREDVLPNAREVDLEFLVENFYTVATTAITNEDATKHVRYPFLEPADLSDELDELEADVCVVFGRERVGLTNEELARFDRVCSIPASDSYPVLNLAQAATIVLYELREVTVGETQHPDDPHERADEHEIEGLYETLDRKSVV